MLKKIAIMFWPSKVFYIFDAYYTSKAYASIFAYSLKSFLRDNNNRKTLTLIN